MVPDQTPRYQRGQTCVSSRIQDILKTTYISLKFERLFIRKMRFPCYKRAVKTRCFLAIPCLATLLCAQNPNEATLTFVTQPGKNEIDIDLDVSLIGSSSDTSTVTGTMQVLVNISPITGLTDELTILSADAATSDVNLSGRRFLVGSYNLDAENITFDINTPEAPGEVDPTTGEFDASQHQVTTTGGTVGGSANTLATGDLTVPDIPLDDPPFTGTVNETGTLTVTPGRVEGRRYYYDLTLRLPVGFSETVSIPDLPITIDVAFALGGELEATGETFLEFPDYQDWAEVSGLAPNSEDNTDIHGSAPNYFFYALGFTAQNAPTDLFSFGSEGAVLQTGSIVALDDLEIQWSDDLITWTRVPANAMVSGESQFGFRDSLANAPTVDMTAGKKYLRLARPTAP